MNIIELQDKLEKQNINLSARDICEIWGMNEQNFSRKKKQGTAIKHKNIAQLEKELNICDDRIFSRCLFVGGLWCRSFRRIFRIYCY